MKTHRSDVTAWELEAARRREVIADDFGARRHKSPSLRIAEGTNGLTARMGGWASAVVQRVRNEDTATDESLSCGHAAVR